MDQFYIHDLGPLQTDFQFSKKSRGTFIVFGFWNILCASHQVAEREMGCVRVYVCVLCMYVYVCP